VKEDGIDQIRILSDPNRLAILSLLSMREMTITQLSNLLGISVQNAQYHVKKLVEADLIVRTRSEVIGNLVEKYYRSAFGQDMMSGAMTESDMDFSERRRLVLAAMGAIKGILDRGIMMLDERRGDDSSTTEPKHLHPFAANYAIIPNTPVSAGKAESLVADIDRSLQELAEEHGEQVDERFALVYALFPYD